MMLFSFWAGMIDYGLMMCGQGITTGTTDNIYWPKRYKVDGTYHLFNTSVWGGAVHHALRLMLKENKM